MKLSALVPVDLGRQRLAILGLLFVFLAALNLQYVIKVAFSGREHRSAFMRWQVQLREQEHGENIWAKYAYPNPPIMALILEPFAALPPVAGSVVWFYSKVLMATLAIGWIFSLLERGDAVFPFWGKVVAVLLCLRPIEGDLVHGNINLFILFLVVAAIYALCSRRHFLSGLLFALAMACKVTPALFLPYLVWKRAWWALAGAAVGIVLFVWVVPGAALGWDKNQEYLGSWYRNMIVPYAIEGKVTSELQNQSLPGLMSRLLTYTQSRSTYDEDNQLVVLERHNIVDWNPRVVGWLVKGCMALFALVLCWRARTPLDDRSGWPLLAEMAIVVLGMLLFSERTWKHHCVTLLVPYAVIAYCWSARVVPVRLQWCCAATLVGSGLLILATSTGLFPGQDRFGELAQVYGAYVWAHLLLLACLLALLGYRPRQDSMTSVLPAPSVSEG